MARAYGSFQVIKEERPQAVCLFQRRAMVEGRRLVGLLLSGQAEVHQDHRQEALCAARRAGAGV